MARNRRKEIPHHNNRTDEWRSTGKPMTRAVMREMVSVVEGEKMISQCAYTANKPKKHRFDRVIFDSAHQLAGFVEATHNWANMHSEADPMHQKPQTRDFIGEPMVEALANVRAARVPQSVMDRFKNAVSTIGEQGYAVRMSAHNSPTGGVVSVPRYLSGNPKNMRQIRKTVAKKPVLKIAVQLAASCACETNDFINRGAALIELVRLLEGYGYSCELWACASVYADGGSDAISAEVKIKPAHAQLTATDAAYLLTQQAGLRRLLWHVWELDLTRTGKEVCDSNYGCGISPDILDHFDLHTDYMHEERAPERGEASRFDFATPEKARKTLIKDFSDQLEAKGLPRIDNKKGRAAA